MKLKIYSFKNVKSTNDTALRFIKNNITNGVITSETQKKGRGQYGNCLLYTSPSPRDV